MGDDLSNGDPGPARCLGCGGRTPYGIVVAIGPCIYCGGHAGWDTPRGRIFGVSVDAGEVGMLVGSTRDGSSHRGIIIVNRPFEPFRVPAMCTVCDEFWPTDLTVQPGAMDVDVEGPLICPKCGGESVVPDPLVVVDRNGRNYDVRRLDVLRRAVQTILEEGLTGEQLVQARDLLERVQSGETTVEEAEGRAGGGVARLLAIARDPAWQSIGVVVMILIAVVSVMLADRDEPMTDREVDRVSERVAERLDPALVAPDREGERHVDRDSRTRRGQPPDAKKPPPRGRGRPGI